MINYHQLVILIIVSLYFILPLYCYAMTPFYHYPNNHAISSVSNDDLPWDHGSAATQRPAPNIQSFCAASGSGILMCFSQEAGIDDILIL